jgi:hypothetical protein
MTIPRQILPWKYSKLNGKEEKMIKRKMMLIMITAVLFMNFFSTEAFSDEARKVPENLVVEEVEEIFNSARYQANISRDKNLGVLAGEVSYIPEDTISLGFAAKSEEAKNFIIGALYSEALAFLRGGNLELAAKRLESMAQEFINLNAPGSLYSYTGYIINLVQTKRHTPEVILEFLSLFQSFYEDYAKSTGKDRLILFRAGSWLVDMSLTAAAGDKLMLQQPGTLAYFIKEMKRMDAPKGVIDSLDEIAKIAEKKDITDKDIKQILKRVKKIQTLLG